MWVNQESGCPVPPRSLDQRHHFQDTSLSALAAVLLALFEVVKINVHIVNGGFRCTVSVFIETKVEKYAWDIHGQKETYASKVWYPSKSRLLSVGFEKDILRKAFLKGVAEKGTKLSLLCKQRLWFNTGLGVTEFVLVCGRQKNRSGMFLCLYHIFPFFSRKKTGHCTRLVILGSSQGLHIG